MGGLESILNNCNNWLTQRPKYAAVISGISSTILAGGALELINYFLPDVVPLFGYVALPFFGLHMAQSSYNKRVSSKSLKEIGIDLKVMKKRLLEKKISHNVEKDLVRKIMDFSFEHPISSGVAFGTALTIATFWTGSAIYGVDDVLQNIISNSELSFSLAAMGTGMCLASYYFFKEGSYFFHSSSASLMKESLKLGLTRKFRSKENVFEAYKNAVEKHDYTSFTGFYAGLCAERGDSVTAFEVLMNIYEHKSPGSISFADNAAKVSEVKIMIHNNHVRMKNNPESFSSYFTQVPLLESIGESGKALEVMENFIMQADTMDDIRLDANLSYAMFLKKACELDKFKEQFVKILGLYADKIEKIKSYNSYSLIEDEFSRKTFVIRRNANRTPLDNERKYNEMIKNNFNSENDDKSLKIMETPEVLEFENEFYSATFYESGKTLTDSISDFNLSIFKRVARFMGRIHGSNELYESKEVSYYVNSLFSKIESVKDSNLDELKSVIIDNVPLLFEGFDDFMRVVDVDAHGENWIIGKKYTKIDNQAREPTLPFFECSKLLEQGTFLSDDDIIRDKVLLSYYSELANFHPVMPFDEFKFHKLKSDPIKSFSYFFFSYNDPNRCDTSYQFLKNSLYSLENLEKYLTSKHDSVCLNNLKKASIDMQSFVSQ